MTTAQLFALYPFLILGATATVLLLAIAFVRSHILAFALAALGFTYALLSLPALTPILPIQITGLLRVDLFGLFYSGLILAACLVVAFLSYGYLEPKKTQKEEFYLLLMLAGLGAIVMVASTHFISFFLGLELLSISLYVMVAYLAPAERAIEAGVKYLVLAGASAGFMLFGIALVYSQLGTMSFARIAAIFDADFPVDNLWILAGFSLLLTGIGFKLAAVPFHMWTPDVYEGAPAPVTGFIATVSKGAMMAVLLRFSWMIGIERFPRILALFAAIAVASMFVGNFLGLLQRNVKRILAYSSIAHIGYALVAYLAGGPTGLEAVSYYLLAYFATSLCAFGVIAAVSGEHDDIDDIDSYRGLFWKRPILGGLMAASMFSLGGIPLTAGFIGKYYVLVAGVGTSLWFLVFMLALNSTIGIYYYLRVVMALFADPGPNGELAHPPRVSLFSGAALATLGVLILWLGVYPAPFFRLVQDTVNSLFG